MIVDVFQGVSAAVDAGQGAAGAERTRRRARSPLGIWPAFRTGACVFPVIFSCAGACGRSPVRCGSLGPARQAGAFPPPLLVPPCRVWSVVCIWVCGCLDAAVALELGLIGDSVVGQMDSWGRMLMGQIDS